MEKLYHQLEVQFQLHTYEQQEQAQCTITSTILQQQQYNRDY